MSDHKICVPLFKQKLCYFKVPTHSHLHACFEMPDVYHEEIGQ